MFYCHASKFVFIHCSLDPEIEISGFFVVLYLTFTFMVYSTMQENRMKERIKYEYLTVRLWRNKIKNERIQKKIKNKTKHEKYEVLPMRYRINDKKWGD